MCPFGSRLTATQRVVVLFGLTLVPAMLGAAGQNSTGADDQAEMAQPRSASPAPVSARPLTNDERLLLVLNRFTYGPRPGDLEHVRQMGLSAWITQQLKPETIDDSALDARLKAFPALQMPLEKMMELYPTNGQIRRTMEGKLSPPGGEAARAIYATQEERYRDKRERKAGRGQADREIAALSLTGGQLLDMAPNQRFSALLRLTPEQRDDVRRSMSGGERSQLLSGMTPSQIEALAALGGPQYVVASEDQEAKLLRDIYSERQLQEVMVDFWLNHFNVYMKKSQEAPYFIAAYERDAIRPFALGKFENLLLATATSPAMLNYLDNSSSVGPHSDYARGRGRDGKRANAIGLNENYAREVMELHTVGVGGGYSQQDVTELARVFTGWTVGKAPKHDLAATATFDGSKHEPGDKTVLGRRIQYNGQHEGVEALKMLANTPECARFLSRKLAVRFVSDDPPAAMIDRMTAAYAATHGDIRRVLLAMINSPEFITSATYRAKVKTPQDFVVSAVRAAGSSVDNAAGLAAAIEALGMPLYGKQTPNGYSMSNGEWNSTAALVSRMNFALALGANRVQGVSTDLSALLGDNPENLTAEDKQHRLEAKLLQVPVSAKTEQLILAQISMDPHEQASELRQLTAVSGKRRAFGSRSNQTPGSAVKLDTQAALAAGLIFGSPEFQRR